MCHELWLKVLPRKTVLSCPKLLGNEGRNGSNMAFVDELWFFSNSAVLDVLKWCVYATHPLWFRPKQTGCRLDNKTNTVFPISFSQFHPRSSPPPRTNEMCQSQDTLLAAESISSVGQVRSRLLPISLAGNKECPPPPPPSIPNGSYQTHQEICDRTILRPWEDCHQLPQRWRIMSANALHLCAFYLCMPECYFYIS